MQTKSWICFHLAGYGEILAKLPGGVLPNDDFTVTHPCSVSLQQPNPDQPPVVVVARHMANRLGVAEGGMRIDRSKVTWWGGLRKDLAEQADARWSKIQKPTPGQIHRLNGGRK